MRSGLQANRPAASSAGNVYFATDTGRFFADTGTAWVGFITEGGQATVTGWTLIDPVIRDALQFGPEGSGAIDNNITRTGANALRTDSNLGVGVAPAAWLAGYGVAQVGSGSLASQITAPVTWLGGNTYIAAGGDRPVQGDHPASRVQLYDGGVQLQSAPAVAAGAVQAFTTRLSVDAAGVTTLNRTNTPGFDPYLTLARSGAARWPIGLTPSDGLAVFSSDLTQVRVEVGQTTGTLTVTPVSGEDALVCGQAGHHFVIRAAANAILLAAPGGLVGPATNNASSSGDAEHKWTAVYAVAGTINTSLAEAKQDITPLDPAACYQAAKDVRWYDFRYRPPAFTPPEPGPDTAYDEHDSNEVKAEKKVLRDEAEAAALAAHAKMLVETAPARHQRGFVFPVGVEAQDEAGGSLPPVPDLFGLEDRESTTPQADLATLGAALQYLIQKVEALESMSGQAPAA